MRRLDIVGVFLALAVLCGCAGVSGVSNDSGSKSGAGVALAVSPNTLAFGNVSVGGSKTSSLTLSNGSSGGANITISQISITGSGFSIASAPTLPLDLAAGQSLDLSIVFAPGSAGAASGNLSITCTAANSPVTVPLSGNGLAAGQIGVSPATMDFGDVAVGSSSDKPGSLTAGASPITVDSADWSGQGYSLSGITFPAGVPAGQSISFTVTFAPQTAGTSSGSVSFVSDASNSPSVVSLTGNGTQQQAQHSVDLSWDPSIDPVVGYNIYRGTHTGGPYTKLNSSSQAGTSYTDGSVQSGQTYFYVATAVDTNSQESQYSNQVTAAIPTP